MNHDIYYNMIKEKKRVVSELGFMSGNLKDTTYAKKSSSDFLDALKRTWKNSESNLFHMYSLIVTSRIERFSSKVWK